MLFDRKFTRRQFLGLTLSLGALLPGYAFGIEPGFRLAVQRYRIRPPGWPKGQRLKIAALADPHLGGPWMPLSRLRQIVVRTNALEPDMIVLLGDYRVGHRFGTQDVPFADIAKVFADLQAPLGTHAILGNHDWWQDPKAQARRAGPTEAHRAFADAGLPVLENRALRIGQGAGDRTGDGSFWLLGLGDQRAFPGRGGVDDLAGTLAQVTDDAPAILLAHEPDIFPKVPKRIALTLSGHTHGGQVRLFGHSPIVPSRFGNRYAYGHVREGGRDLVVSGGLGCSILPVRLGVPPEITMVELA